MFLYIVLLNCYFRLFLIFLNPNNFWHWRLPAQGLANEIVAASLFYLALKILWVIIPFIRLRKIVFFIFLIAWSGLNYINYEFAAVFNTLLPFSWFQEAQNVTAMDSGMDLLKGLYHWQFLVLVIIPIVVGAIIARRYAGNLFQRPKLRYLIGVFLAGSFMQSMTLFPDIQPRRDSIIQSHLFKYWYYESQDQPLNKIRTAPLPEFSELFRKTVLGPAQSDRNMLPVLKNPKRNVVLIMLESFRAYEIGAYGATLGITPNFDRYAKKGILFKNIYSSGPMTRYGIWSTVCSSHVHRGDPVLINFKEHPQRCLPDLLAERGYDNWWFHGQSASYDFQGYFFKRHHVPHIMDRLTFPADAKVLGWGLSDLDLFKHALSQLKRIKGPFFWLIQSQTNHHPFTVPDRFRKYSGYSDVMNGYFNTFHFTDYCLGLFLDTFLKTPQGKNSLIVITADHGLGVQLYDPTRFPEKREQIKYNIPLLILYPEDEHIMPMEVEEVGGQVDIVPTLLDIMRVKTDVPFFGRSFVRDYRHRYAKAMIRSNFIITKNRVYYIGSPDRVVRRDGRRLAVTEKDKAWFNLIHEIDDVQDWMIQSKTPEAMRDGLLEKGWHRGVLRPAE